MAGLFDANWFSPSGSTYQGPSYVAPGYQTKTPAQILQEQTDAYDVWRGSSLGQNTMAAEESATAYSRKQADATMHNAKRQLDLQVQQLRQQGRNQEAQIALQKGTLQIARQRLAWEQQIKQQELAQQQQQFEKTFGLSEAGVTGSYNGRPTEAARQYNQTYGLNRAEAIARYSSTPDQMFMRSDLMNALRSAESGQGPQPYGATGQPTMKTSADWDAIAGPAGSLAAGATGAAVGAGAGGGTGQTSEAGEYFTTNAASGTGTTTQTDPRVQAATGVVRALPPSESGGIDHNDAAALSAIESIFRAQKPGTLQRMRPGQQQAFQGGLSRLGYYAPDALAEMSRNAPRQGRANAA
jgi:hypothetical protein